MHPGGAGQPEQAAGGGMVGAAGCRDWDRALYLHSPPPFRALPLLLSGSPLFMPETAVGLCLELVPRLNPSSALPATR